MRLNVHLGPILEDIAYLSSTYRTCNVFFVSPEAMKRARAQTGWKEGIDPDLALEIPFFEEMLECLQFDGNGIPVRCFYSDWTLEDGHVV